jgi:hypothetical protein
MCMTRPETPCGVAELSLRHRREPVGILSHMQVTGFRVINPTGAPKS